ncbi:PREDICTED: transmembrane protein 156 [Odobenus rosmarus divergens]|uniref:Transmembrane protein 156 n=1 Tax=Odobenus rosmarus divergens TaxID=9708 RepID=A0A2U3VME8_ODORO|nr:PREDICTED: transmembrane protein 156 [Odobenus rosmarus divergens]
MTKTALFKLLLAIVIAFILLLPEYFKTPKGNILELSCLEVCLQPNFNYSLRSLNFSFVAFLKPVRESQTIMGIFLNHSNFQNFTRICQGITSELKMCSSCLACESKKRLDFISQEQTSKVLIMKGSTEVKANDFRSPCQHFNFTVAPIVDPLEEYNITCNLKTHMRRPAIMEEDSPKEKSMNHTCRTMEHLNNCTRISLHLEMDVKNFTCSMKITWYVLVLVVFIFFLILTLHKILESHRRMWKWRSNHPGAPTSALLRGQDSEKLRTLNVRVISETKQRLPLTQVKKVLPPIPELEVTSMVHLQDQYTR